MQDFLILRLAISAFNSVNWATREFKPLELGNDVIRHMLPTRSYLMLPEIDRSVNPAIIGLTLKGSKQLVSNTAFFFFLK